MSKEETLERLAANRKAFALRMEAVEADLARERERRLAVYVNEIRADVLRAAAEGASIASIQRAYGTRDFRTIKKIIEAGAAEVEAHKARIEEEANPTWFDLDGSIITMDSAAYDVIDLDAGEYMLDLIDGVDTMNLNGAVLSANDTGERKSIYDAIVNQP